MAETATDFLVNFKKEADIREVAGFMREFCSPAFVEALLKELKGMIDETEGALSPKWETRRKEGGVFFRYREDLLDSIYEELCRFETDLLEVFFETLRSTKGTELSWMIATEIYSQSKPSISIHGGSRRLPVGR